jgi:hypothetical protein
MESLLLSLYLSVTITYLKVKITEKAMDLFLSGDQVNLIPDIQPKHSIEKV